DTACIGQLEPAHALGLPREEALEQLETPGQIAVEIGELGVAEAIQLTLRARLEADRAARAVQGQGRADEALADAGHDRDGEGAGLEVVEAANVGDGELPLRSGARGARGVSLEEHAEHAAQLALGRADHHEVVLARKDLEQLEVGVAVHDRGAEPIELLEPAGHLDPLVDRLRVAVERAGELQQARAARRPDREADGSDRGALVLPEAEAELAFHLKCLVEHALRREHATASDLLGRSVRDERHLVTVPDEPESEQEAGLAGAENSDPARGHGSGDYRGYLVKWSLE